MLILKEMYYAFMLLQTIVDAVRCQQKMLHLEVKVTKYVQGVNLFLCIKSKGGRW